MAATTYAVLGSTGNCGTALIEHLLQRPNAQVNAFCRNRLKLLKLFPQAERTDNFRIFEGGLTDVELLASCVQECQAVFLVCSTNDNIPGCHIAQDAANTVVKALQLLRQRNGRKTPPKLVLLSSATIDDHLSRQVPYFLRLILLRSASHVYEDLVRTEKFLRAQEDWLTTIYVKPGALSVDIQRGHALSLTDEESPVSYLDLAAAMIEAVDDKSGRYDQRNVSVVNTHGRAKFPAGTPMCIFMGLLRHFFPFMHPYLPATGPR